MSKIYALEESELFKLASRLRLAQLLGSSANLIKTELRDGLRYREWDEAKATGGFRHIEDPNAVLKAIQEKIANMLMKIEPPAYLMCPAKGRSTFDNALVHIGKRVVRNIDIKKYFPSTPEKRVAWFYGTYMQCSPDVAYQLTKLSCFNGHLPTGSPLSPILSHFAFRSMWDEISLVCQQHQIGFTVWIDDITLSGAKVPERVVWQIKNIIAKNELRYHKERQYIDDRARVTGLIAGSDNTLRLPHRYFLNLREARRALSEAYEKNDHLNFSKLEGRVKGIEGQAVQLERKIKKHFPVVTQNSTVA